MNNFIKKIFGIDKIEAATEEAVRSRIEAEHAADLAWKEASDARETERIAKASPKTIATEKKEPWITVLETHINPENPRNGFFEFDWNDYFITSLRENGYTGGSDEEVVDGWFRDLCLEVGTEENIMMDRRFSGHIDVRKLNNGKSEVN